MAQNLNESSTYETAVPSIETDDDVVGSVPAGDPNLGIANDPHVKLANRTKYLKTQSDSHETSIAAAQAAIVGLNSGKANKANETHTGEHKFTSSIVREFIPVPSSQARKVKSWELGFGLEEAGVGIAPNTSKNLIQAVAGVERLLYTECFAIALTGSIIHHNSIMGLTTNFYSVTFRGLMLPLSQDPAKPYSLVRFSKVQAVVIPKSRLFYMPVSSPGAEYISGGIDVEVLETDFDGGDTNEHQLPIIGVFSDFAGGQNEAKVFIRNGHNTGYLDYLQGWLKVRSCPNLIATVV